MRYREVSCDEKNSYNVLLRRKSSINSTSSSTEFVDLTTDKNILIVDDVFNALKKIPDKSISTIVTSPPYWNLRDYKDNLQLGSESDPEIYVQKMIEIGNELLRVLKDNGSYFFNIGDTYVNQGLQMIPQKIAMGMQERGWLIRNQIIWFKPNHMPSPVKHRFSNTYEMIYFFTKNDWEKRVNFNLDTIRVPHKSDFKEQYYKKGNLSKFIGEDINLGASPAARLIANGEKYITKRKIEATQENIVNYLKKHLIKKNYKISDLINKLGYMNYKHKVGHWFRMDAGGSYPSKDDWMKLKKILDFDDTYDKQMIKEYTELHSVKAHPKGKNPGDLFISNTAKSKYEHFAVFPESIPELAIKSTCPKDGIVLDPFAGTGTTGVVAERHSRKVILIDIQPKFADIIKERINNIIEYN